MTIIQRYLMMVTSSFFFILTNGGRQRLCIRCQYLLMSCSAFFVLLLTASVGGFRSHCRFVKESAARTHHNSGSHARIESTASFSYMSTDAMADEANRRRVMLQQMANIVILPAAAATSNLLHSLPLQTQQLIQRPQRRI